MTRIRAGRAGRAAAAASRPLVALAVLLVALVLGVAPAIGATSDVVDVHVQCVWKNTDGTMTAVWSYVNHSSAAVDIPVGSDNRLTTQPEDQGQPTHFLPGEHLNAWVVTFDTSLAWHVLTNGDTANNGSTACATNPVSVVGNWRALGLGLAILLPVAAALLRRTRAHRLLGRPALPWAVPR